MSEYTYHTETIDTNAGEYTIELSYDSDAANPLTDWDNPGLACRVDWHSYGGRWSTAVDTLADAGDAATAIERWLYDYNESADIERRYKIWRAITGSPWQLFTGEDMASRSDWYRWLVLVDTREHADPKNAVRDVVESYATFAQGMVTAYRVINPSGEDIASCGGFYRDSDATEDARDHIEYDVRQRIEKSALVGAGFIGLV